MFNQIMNPLFTLDYLTPNQNIRNTTCHSIWIIKGTLLKLVNILGV